MLVLLNKNTLTKDAIGMIHDLGKHLHYTEVKSFKEASEACRTYIATLDLGASCFTGGAILDDKKNHIADVVYNGKVFDMNHNILYNPYEVNGND